MTPTVWLVIDNSTSMNEPFGSTSRWQALRAALMDEPGGVVTQLQSSVRFGMVGYSGPIAPLCRPQDHINASCGCRVGWEDACCTEACGFDLPDTDWCMAQLDVVNPASANRAPVDMAYAVDPKGGWTPTDRALEYVVGQLPAQGVDPKNPIYTVLATDGEPNDFCLPEGTPRSAVPERVLAAATAGVQKGMQLLVISMAGDDQELQAHLEQVAAIANPMQVPFTPENSQQLTDTLRQIVQGATCQVHLDGTVMTGRECEGTVQLNGTALPCNSDNGWRLPDPSTVQLTGEACTTFVNMSASVTAEFPCGVFVPQ